MATSPEKSYNVSETLEGTITPSTKRKEHITLDQQSHYSNS